MVWSVKGEPNRGDMKRGMETPPAVDVRVPGRNKKLSRCRTFD